MIEEFAKGKNFLTFAGIPPTSKITEQFQRNIFANQLGDQIGIKNITAQNWSSLFSLLARHVGRDPFIILFDEISWMG